MPALRPLLIAALLLALSAALPAPRVAYAAGVVGSGTPASCTEADLAAKLSGGGTITFNCGPSPATIAITSEKLISADTTLDGGGKITLHGNGATRILRTIDGTFNGTAVLKVINVTIQGLTIENGVTNDQGGAIRVGFWNNFTLKDSTLRDNRATKDDANCAGGGALFIGGGSTARIEGSSFSNNTTNNHGGGLFAGLYPNEAIEISGTTFDGNVVTKASTKDSSGTGGGIWYGSATGAANNATFTLKDSTLSRNKAVGQGGGFWTSAGATISNVTFFGNDATDSSISDPDDWRRGNGGALAVNNNAPIAITNATFANNHSGFNGGAVAGGSTVTVKNTLFANNTTDWPIKIMQHCTNALTDGSNNMQFPAKNPNPNFFNETNCTNSITIADPQLGALADNGGRTQTMALPNASPAVGAGNNATCPATDQRGVARPQGASCDIGAFELVLALALSPGFAGVGGPGFTLTVTGSGFGVASKVLWDGQERPTTFVSATTLRAAIAASDISVVGDVPVSVSVATLPAVDFRVVAQVTRVYLPLLRH